jgi:hypothetical protein
MRDKKLVEPFSFFSVLGKSASVVPKASKMQNSLNMVDKLEAARRQLDCAIRLFFENDDSLAIIRFRMPRLEFFSTCIRSDLRTALTMIFTT